MDADISCASCGYNLRTLAIDGLCPECAQPVRDSLDEARRLAIRLGPPLEIESRRWLLTGAVGLFLLLGAPPVRACIAFLQMLKLYNNPSTRPAVVSTALLVSEGVWLILVCVAVWMFTRPGRAEKAQTTWIRTAIRIPLTATTLLVIGHLVWFLVVGLPQYRTLPWWEVAFYASNAVTTVASFAYLAHIAGRSRNMQLRRVCFLLSGFGLLMVFWVVSNLSQRVFIVRLPMLMPETPLLGPLVNNPLLSLVYNPSQTLQRIASAGWFELLDRTLLPLVWLICSSATLAYFGVLFMRAAREAALRERGAANSLQRSPAHPDRKNAPM